MSMSDTQDEGREGRKQKLMRPPENFVRIPAGSIYREPHFSPGVILVLLVLEVVVAVEVL